MGISERKEREFKRRERDILDAAARLFDRDDWQVVSIERIAQEAEIGKGTVYLHFPSKEAIYGRLALEFASGVLVGLRGIDPALSIVEQIHAAVRIFLEAHRQSRSHHRVSEYCKLDDFRRRLDDETRVELERVDAEVMALIHGMVERGIATGVFADRPLDELLLGAHAAVLGAVRLFGSPWVAGWEPERLIREVTRFVLAGLMYLDRVPLAPAPTQDAAADLGTDGEQASSGPAAGN